MRFTVQQCVVWLVIGVQLSAACFICGTKSVNRQTEKSAVTSNSASLPEAVADSASRRLVGVWKDEYQGHRTLTIRPDGTSTMVVELCGLHRLFAKTLTFEQEWSLDGDQLQFVMLGGEPAAKVEFVMELKGTKISQKVLKLTDSQLLVYDAGEKVEMDWRRVPTESSGSHELAQR